MIRELIRTFQTEPMPELHSKFEHLLENEEWKALESPKCIKTTGMIMLSSIFLFCDPDRPDLEEFIQDELNRKIQKEVAKLKRAKIDKDLIFKVQNNSPNTDAHVGAMNDLVYRFRNLITQESNASGLSKVLISSVAQTYGRRMFIDLVKSYDLNSKHTPAYYFSRKLFLLMSEEVNNARNL